MKTGLFIMSVLIMCCSYIPTFSQNQQSTQELLMSTKRESQDIFDEESCGYIWCSKTEYMAKITSYGKLDLYNYSYYLSSFPYTVFDITKVGKNDNGRYIIQEVTDFVIIHEILELTSTGLLIRDITPGFVPTGNVITYLPTNMNL